MTIKEMAKQYGKSNPIIHNPTFDTWFDWEDAADNYEEGANTVLEEIEKAMDLGDPPYLISKDQAYDVIEKTIKKLKG